MNGAEEQWLRTKDWLAGIMGTELMILMPLDASIRANDRRNPPSCEAQYSRSLPKPFSIIGTAFRIADTAVCISCTSAGSLGLVNASSTRHVNTVRRNP